MGKNGSIGVAEKNCRYLGRAHGLIPPYPTAESIQDFGKWEVGRPCVLDRQVAVDRSERSRTEQNVIGRRAIKN